MKLFASLLVGLLIASPALPKSPASDVPVKAPWFGIHIIDEATQRGVPLVELRTVNDVRGITDSAGWIAFQEPGLMDREVWFYLSLAPGYEMAKDGFGYTGARLRTAPGTSVTLQVKRTNTAERIARTTGQGIYRDSELLGLKVPVPNLSTAGVMGQDSVQAVPYSGRIYWLWGDTNVPHYPLGNFQTTGAFTSLKIDPMQGIAFDYITDSTRPDKIHHMLPLPDQGAVWLFGLLTLKDDQGKEVLVSHWSRHRGLDKWLDHGLARFSDEKQNFEVLKLLDVNDTWRFPRGNAVRSGEWYYFSDGFLYTRVRANWADLTDPSHYEALRFNSEQHTWQWQREQPPTTQNEETKLLLNRSMTLDQARYRLKDAAGGKLVRLHGGSVNWNEHRQRWVLLGLQSGNKEDPSPLGELWYAESKNPDGPWGKAVKVASHPRYSYYNPVHHAFLDAEGGRYIFFEGTYSLEFSGNPVAPARYDYNQLMYRLDLDDARLGPARVE